MCIYAYVYIQSFINIKQIINIIVNISVYIMYVYLDFGSHLNKCDLTVSGNGTPLQYSCLENPIDGRAW